MKFVTILFIVIASNAFSQTTAIYDVTFTSIWNATDHTSIPPNAHWSKLVGVTHKTENTFVQVGSLSTTGIKDIAELGNNTAFNGEVTTQITNGEADQYIDGPSLGTATGDMMISDLMVSEDFPLLSLASMIAPSPDWMIALNGFSLLDGGNNWKTSATIDMFALDAGTDDGVDYTSANSVTNPFQPITVISGAPFQGNKIGTLTITLKDVLGTNEAATMEHLQIFPNPISEGKLFVYNLGDVVLNKVEIYNLSGVQIKSINLDSNQSNLSFDVAELSSGMYLLKLYSDQNKTLDRKIIVE